MLLMCGPKTKEPPGPTGTGGKGKPRRLALRKKKRARAHRGAHDHGVTLGGLPATPSTTRAPKVTPTPVYPRAYRRVWSRPPADLLRAPDDGRPVSRDNAHTDQPASSGEDAAVAARERHHRSAR
jgi:hypothetical protein